MRPGAGAGRVHHEILAPRRHFLHKGSRMTLPANLPPKFRTAARDFADKLRASFASGMPAQPEDQLKAPVAALIETVTSGVLTKTEAQVHELGGRPDIGVEVGKALCGFVELKAPGLGAQTEQDKKPILIQLDGTASHLHRDCEMNDPLTFAECRNF